MPIYEYVCLDCQTISEILVMGPNDTDIECRRCKSKKLKKMFSMFNSKIAGKKVDRDSDGWYGDVKKKVKTGGYSDYKEANRAACAKALIETCDVPEKKVRKIQEQIKKEEEVESAQKIG